MTNTDGERFVVYSSMGVPISEVGTFIQVRSLIDHDRSKVFDAKGMSLARLEAKNSGFIYEFGPEVQPQDIRKAWNKYNNYPGVW